MDQPIRTKLAFHLFVQAEKAWRKRELSDMRKLLRGAQGDRRTLLLRCAIAILYAHWEGFVKAVCEGYLEFVRFQAKQNRLCLTDMSDSFRAMHLMRAVRDIGQAKRSRIYYEAVSLLKAEQMAQIHPVFQKSVSTRANLKFEPFVEVLAQVGLDATGYSDKKYEIFLDRLVGLRNAVAHGDDQQVDDEVFAETFEFVLALLEQFGDQLDNAVEMDQYLKATGPAPQVMIAHE